MTDPSAVLAAVRRGLDAAAQQAAAATEGPWEATFNVHCDPFVDQVGRGPFGRIASISVGPADYGRANATHIAAWSPSHVTAVVGSLRTICDGIEATLADHEVVEKPRHGCCAPPSRCVEGVTHPPECRGHGMSRPRAADCADRNRALASLAGLAAVWAPTEGEAEK